MYSQLPSSMRASASSSSRAIGTAGHIRVSPLGMNVEPRRSRSPSRSPRSSQLMVSRSSRGGSQKTRFHDDRYLWHRSMRDYRLKKAKYYRAMSQVSRNPYKRMQYMYKARKHYQGALAHHRKSVIHDAKRRLGKERNAAIFRQKKPSRMF